MLQVETNPKMPAAAAAAEFAGDWETDAVAQATAAVRQLSFMDQVRGGSFACMVGLGDRGMGEGASCHLIGVGR